MPRLTKRVVDAAQPKEADYFIWCDDLPGFGLRVFASGKRSYLVQYRAGGRTRRVTIGAHGLLTTEEARKEAMALLGQVAKGADPAEERASRRQSLTVKELCTAYLEAAEKGLIMGKGNRPKKVSTLYADKGRIKRHIIPLLGKRLVKDLTTADVNRFLRDVATGKTAAVEKTGQLRGKAVVKGGAGTAARTTGLLGGILSFAVSEGIVSTNPASGVRKPADGQRERRLSPGEYRQLGKTLQAAEDEGENAQAITGVWLLMLTGCRLSEIENLTWSEVDATGHCIRFGDTKEGASVRPIGAPALRVLAKAERKPQCPFVLPATRGRGRYGGLPGGIERIMERAGLYNITAHTLRHSYASVAGDLGYSESTIAALLGHAKGSVTSRYVHHLDAVLIAAADRVANTIDDYLTGATGEVVMFATRK
jgi:integrase